MENEQKTNNVTNGIKSILFAESRNTARVVSIGIGLLILTLITCATTYFIVRTMTRNAAEEVKSNLPFSTDTKEDEKKFDNPAKSSNTVIVGKVQWKVLETSVKNSIDSDEECKAGEGNKFIHLRLELKNLDRAFVTVPRNAIKIYDKDQNEYDVNANRTVTCLENKKYELSDKYIPTVIGLDEAKELGFIFEVPENTKGFRLKAGDLSLISKDYQYIDLDI